MSKGRATNWIRDLRFSALGLALLAKWKRVKRRLRRRGAVGCPGRCPVCGENTRFDRESENAREGLVCRSCGSVPRQRALTSVVEALTPAGGWTAVHESSPSLCSYRYLRRVSRRLTASYYFDRCNQARVGCFHNIDLRKQPFTDNTFDLVLTQDVMEHVTNPFPAFTEIQRTLNDGGCHVFTLPRDHSRATRTRAVDEGGSIVHTEPPQFHKNPITRGGSLVATDWGSDLEEKLLAEGAVHVAAVLICDVAIAVHTPIEVFIAAGSATHLAALLGRVTRRA